VHPVNKYYRLINLLSIDVALGAVSCSVWIAHTFRISVPLQAYFLLGITVWIIYTADHLQDARRLKHFASTKRHSFHQQNFSVLFVFMCIAAVVNGMILLSTPAVILNGLILMVVIFFYLLFNQWVGLWKELLIAILFIGGLFLPIVSFTEMYFPVENIFLIICLFITVLINLLLFSWFDYSFDSAANNPSIAVSLGRRKVKAILVILFLAQSVISFFSTLTMDTRILLGVMNGVLFLIFLFPDFFAPYEKFRLTGDAVFLFPGITLSFQCAVELIF
jgi:hypothetical protein